MLFYIINIKIMAIVGVTDYFISILLAKLL